MASEIFLHSSFGQGLRLSNWREMVINETSCSEYMEKIDLDPDDWWQLADSWATATFDTTGPKQRRWSRIGDYQRWCAPPQRDLTVHIVQINRCVANVNGRILFGLVVSKTDWISHRRQVDERQSKPLEEDGLLIKWDRFRTNSIPWNTS